MILLPLALLALLALAPLALSLRRVPALAGRQAPALALHRAQLQELDRDLAEGRIETAEHATATLEVQRRLLAAASAPDTAPARASRVPLVIALLVIPAGGVALYAVNGHPELPAAPISARAPEVALIARLRERIAQLDPGSERAREGYVLLGNVEDQRGNLPEAAKAWRAAVGIRFDAMLAARAAEAQTLIDKTVSPDSAAMFRRALAEAPADAPWRGIVEGRLKGTP